MAIDVIIALNNEDIAQKIKIIVVSNGFNVVTMCTYGSELIRAIKQFSPSIVISGYKFKDMNLINIYESVRDGCGFLAIVNEPYKSFIQEATDIYCISSPVNASLLINSLEIIYQSEKRVKKLKEKVLSLESKINDRILIEKAKGIIMNKFLLSEEEAYKYIQKSCMNHGIKIIDFSKKLINEKESLF
ncbi:ANTAR domain-containing protein [Clostridium sp. Sa3CUN1]|uniref:ANTAR domain-containing protein n=1 Tax=Clostridium gallinarum TaxID=2762246 RepID=A0ABR8Q356_9CLOT|nr:ANTAR domain-containing protein [Clostridium gallinarum]MBD7914834.1 ANTAR domain-containing protein [Clostridium gallinarum]